MALRQPTDSDLQVIRNTWEQETGLPLSFIRDTLQAHQGEKVTIVDTVARTIIHIVLETRSSPTAMFPDGLFLNVVALLPRTMTQQEAFTIIDFTIKAIVDRRPDLLDTTLGGILSTQAANALASMYNCQSRVFDATRRFIWTTPRQLLTFRGIPF